MTWPSCLVISSVQHGSCVGLVGKMLSTWLLASGKNCFPCSHDPWLSSSAPPQRGPVAVSLPSSSAPPQRGPVAGWHRPFPGVGSSEVAPGGGSPETLCSVGALQNF